LTRPRMSVISWRMRYAALFLLAAALLSGLGCPGEPAPAMPRLEAPDWQDGEVAVYEVRRNDSTLYRSQVTLRFDEELLPNYGPVPTALLTTMVEPVMARQFFYDSSAVVFRRDTLRPLRSFRSLETDIGLFDIEAQYERGAVDIRRQSIEGIEERRLAIRGPAFDNEMVGTLLRALPLTPSTRLTLQAVVPIDLRVMPLQVTVLGTKLISTPLGDILCREVEVASPAKEVRFWYELEQPRRLVGLADPESRTEMVLAGWTPARPDELEAAAPREP
jgi:hypothetical protein